MSKAGELLEFKPEFGLHDGIRNYIKWVKETHPDFE